MIREDKKVWHKCERWERGDDGETKEEIKKENHECQEKK